MTREEVTQTALSSTDKYKNVILELSTGVGKSKIAIDCINKICDKVYNNEKDATSVLIVISQLVHKQNWIDEINKWGGLKTDHIKFTTYNSLHKYQHTVWDIVILDEVQHLSDARKEYLLKINVQYNILSLSATLPRATKDWFRYHYSTKVISCQINEAINSNILPSPTIYLIPLYFDSFVSECIYKNVGKNLPKVNCSWAERWKYIKRKDIEVSINCTKNQYLLDLNSQIDYWKRRTMSGNKFAKTKWLRLCGDRLKWLANLKNATILAYLQELKNYRTLTFCNSIEQSEILGKNCIHSGNKLSDEALNQFNAKKIKHITAVNMLNEGVNLTDCRIGIFANINASEIVVKQRQGRLLRHKKPIMIIPYYANTREEELVKKMIEGHNPQLIKTITNINQIKL